MAKIHARIEQAHYKTTLTTATNQLIADEPTDSGGEDLGFSPSELLAAALGTCTAVTLRMYADRRNMPLDNVDVDVTFERDAAQNTSAIHRTITLTGNLTEEQRQKLLHIANQCFIHKTLSNPIVISTELV